MTIPAIAARRPVGRPPGQPCLCCGLPPGAERDADHLARAERAIKRLRAGAESWNALARILADRYGLTVTNATQELARIRRGRAPSWGWLDRLCTAAGVALRYQEPPR